MDNEDNEIDRPPAWNFQEGVDGKLKSNLQWPYTDTKCPLAQEI